MEPAAEEPRLPFGDLLQTASMALRSNRNSAPGRLQISPHLRQNHMHREISALARNNIAIFPGRSLSQYPRLPLKMIMVGFKSEKTRPLS